MKKIAFFLFLCVMIFPSYNLKVYAIDMPIPYGDYVYYETKHFRFISRKENIPITLSLTNYAEEAIKKMYELSGWKEMKIISVFLINTSDEAESYLSFKPVNKIIINTAHPKNIEYNAMNDYVKSTFLYNLAKLTQLRTTKKFNAFIQKIWKSYPPGWLAPDWYKDAFPLYLTDKLLSDKRENLVYYEHLRALQALYGKFPNYDSVSVRNDNFPYEKSSMYYGISFMKYIERKYAARSILSFQFELSKYLPLLFDLAFKKYFGVCAMKLWDEYKESEIQKGKALLKHVQKEGKSKYTTLLSNRGISTAGVRSQDALGRYYFISYRTPYSGYENVLYDKIENKERRIFRKRYIRSPLVTKEGDIAFLAYRRFSKYENHLSVFLYDVSKNRLRNLKLPKEKWVQHIAYSEKLDLFFGIYTDGVKGEMFLFNNEGQIKRLIPFPKGIKTFQGANFCGDCLVVGATDDEGENFILKYNISTLEIERYQLDKGLIYYPYYNSKSGEFVFASDFEGYISLYRASLDDLKVRRIINTEEIPLRTISYDPLDGLSFLYASASGCALAEMKSEDYLNVYTEEKLVRKEVLLENRLHNINVKKSEFKPLTKSLIEKHWGAILKMSPLRTGLKLGVKDTLDRHYFFAMAYIDFQNLILAQKVFAGGKLLYENQSTPVKFSLYSEAESYYTNFGFGKSFPQRYFDFAGSAEYSFYLTENGLFTINFLLEGLYRMRSEGKYEKNNTNYLYISEAGWYNKMSLSMEYSALRKTPISFDYVKGAFIGVSADYYPFFLGNENNFWNFNLKIETYANVKSSLIFSLGASHSLSTETALFKGKYTNSEFSYNEEELYYIHNDRRLLENKLSVYASLAFPMFYINRTIGTPILYFDKIWFKLLYLADDTFNRSYRDIDLNHKVRVLINLDHHLLFSGFKMRLSLGAEFRISDYLEMGDNSHEHIRFVFSYETIEF